jgi:hypothetical protein
MTTTIDNTRARRRPLIRPAVWALAGAILVIGLGGSAAVAWATREAPDLAQEGYEREARAIIGRHSELAEKWNEFVPRFNSTPESEPGAMEKIEAEGYELTRSLVRDSQSVLAAWRKLTPPPEEAATHATALRAIELTQDGYIDFETFFKTLTDGEIALAGDAEDGAAKLAEAAVLWDQVRAAGAP